MRERPCICQAPHQTTSGLIHTSSRPKTSRMCHASRQPTCIRHGNGLAHPCIELHPKHDKLDASCISSKHHMTFKIFVKTLHGPCPHIQIIHLVWMNVPNFCEMWHTSQNSGKPANWMLGRYEWGAQKRPYLAETAVSGEAKHSFGILVQKGIDPCVLHLIWTSG